MVNFVHWLCNVPPIFNAWIPITARWVAKDALKELQAKKIKG